MTNIRKQRTNKLQQTGNQYAGLVGKNENCQVGVYGALAYERYGNQIDQDDRIFIPSVTEGYRELIEKIKSAYNN